MKRKASGLRKVAEAREDKKDGEKKRKEGRYRDNLSETMESN